MNGVQHRQGSDCAHNDTPQTPRINAKEERSEIKSELPENQDSNTRSGMGITLAAAIKSINAQPDSSTQDLALQNPRKVARRTEELADLQKEGICDDASKAHYTLVSFSQDDPDNPVNWSAARKIYILFAGIISVINSTLGSSLPSGAIEYLASYFHVTNEQQLVLPISLFLVGYVIGPVIFGPLSETYGRKLVMVESFVVFTIFTMACALAPNWPAFLVFRLICGLMASSAITVVGGLYADVFAEPIIRGRAMAAFMAVSKACTLYD